ncbi:MAG: hypothetical protein HKN82_10185 [Akkermansiaceae bacterium]|nr:hypothetical protein [Akkermansiaceae bacterium]
MNASICISIILASTALVGAEVAVMDGRGDLAQPFAVVFGADGTLYGVEFEKGNRVFAVSPDRKTFTIVAGVGGKGGKALGDVAEGDGGPAKKARFNGMHDLAIAPDGTLYIADTFNNRIRILKPGSGEDAGTWTVDTFAGTGGKGAFGGDGGPARNAKLNRPHTVTLSPDSSRLLVADLGNRRIREIDLKTTIIRTVAGSGRRGSPRDGGTAIREPLVDPRAACYGADGRTIYIASRGGNALREVTPDGQITTVVNPDGTKGYANGTGLVSKLNGPKHVSLDPDGNVVIADDQNHCIRLYQPKNQVVSLLAGIPEISGKKLGRGRLDTLLNSPHGARYDADGTLHVADSMNDRIVAFSGK